MSLSPEVTPVPLTGPAAADLIDAPPSRPLATYNDQPVELRYGLRGLRLLEQKFGSVPEAFRRIDRAAKAMQDPNASDRADVFTVVIDAIVPGLSHVRTAGGGRLSDDPEAVIDLLDEVDLQTLIGALSSALSSSFGGMTSAAGNVQAPAPEVAPATEYPVPLATIPLTPTPSSHGATGTASPSSIFTEVTPSSGT